MPSPVSVGVRRALPIVLGYVPVGFAFGVLAVKSQIPPFLAVLMSVLLFAGSGQLGIEALSRGAEKAVFVDLNRRAVNVVNENLEHCRLKEKASVFNGDSLSYLKTAREKFDIIFIDPPYKKGLAEKALSLAPQVMNDGGIIVCETDRNEEMPEFSGKFREAKRETYSKTQIVIYRYTEDTAERG